MVSGRVCGGDRRRATSVRDALTFREWVDCDDLASASHDQHRYEEAKRPTAKDENALGAVITVDPQRTDATSERFREHRACRWHSRRNLHDAAFWHRHSLGEDARSMHANELPVTAEILVASRALGALAASDQRIDDDGRAIDGADHLVAENQRRYARARIAPVRMQIRATDASKFDVNDDLMSIGRRLRHLAVLNALPALPNERLHANCSTTRPREVRASLTMALTARRSQRLPRQ